MFIYKSRFKVSKKKLSFVSFFNITGCLIYIERVFVLIWHSVSPWWLFHEYHWYYRVFVLIWHGLSPWLSHEYYWFFTLYSCSFLLKFNSNLHTTLTWKHKITHAVNVTIYIAFFIHFRGTNHIGGSRLSIGKAGVNSKEQDKKKKKQKLGTMAS